MTCLYWYSTELTVCPPHIPCIDWPLALWEEDHNNRMIYYLMHISWPCSWVMLRWHDYDMALNDILKLINLYHPHMADLVCYNVSQWLGLHVELVIVTNLSLYQISPSHLDYFQQYMTYNNTEWNTITTHQLRQWHYMYLPTFHHPLHSKLWQPPPQTHSCTLAFFGHEYHTNAPEHPTKRVWQEHQGKPHKALTDLVIACAYSDSWLATWSGNKAQFCHPYWDPKVQWVMLQLSRETVAR